VDFTHEALEKAPTYARPCRLDKHSGGQDQARPRLNHFVFEHCPDAFVTAQILGDAM